MISPPHHRVELFKTQLISLIPCRPPSARQELSGLSLCELVAIYVNWRDRFISPRRRAVVMWPGFWRHGEPDQHWNEIFNLSRRVQSGEDLRPFLSDRIDTDGYVSRKRLPSSRRQRGVEWGDKDYVLNAYGVHHLHLSERGSRHLLFVSFSRSDAFFLMLGDHASFDDGTLAAAIAECRVGTAEEFVGILPSPTPYTHREQNSLQRGGFTTAFQHGDHVVLGAFISGVGTSPFHTRYGDEVATAINSLDAKLDDRNFQSNFLARCNMASPGDNLQFEWMMAHCDLCILEKTSGAILKVCSWRR